MRFCQAKCWGGSEKGFHSSSSTPGHGLALGAILSAPGSPPPQPKGRWGPVYQKEPKLPAAIPAGGRRRTGSVGAGRTREAEDSFPSPLQSPEVLEQALPLGMFNSWGTRRRVCSAEPSLGTASQLTASPQSPGLPSVKVEVTEVPVA